MLLLLFACLPRVGPNGRESTCPEWRDLAIEPLDWGLPDYGRPSDGEGQWFDQPYDRFSDGLNWGLVDLTGDGLRDLVVAGRDGTVTAGPAPQALGRTVWLLHENTGEGFAEGVEWALPDYGRPPDAEPGEQWFDETFDRFTDGLGWVLLDLTSDGRPDLVVTGRDATVSGGPQAQGLGRTAWLVHENTGAGFADGVEWALPDYGRPPDADVGEQWFDNGYDRFSDGLNWRVVDLDGDGALDLVVSGRDATVSQGPTTAQLGRRAWALHANTGAGFGEAATFELPEYGRPPDAGDGEQWFAEASDRFTDGLNWALADLDGDGAPDLVVTGRDASVPQGPAPQGLGRRVWSFHRNVGMGMADAVDWPLPDYGTIPDAAGEHWFSLPYDRATDGLAWVLVDVTADGAPELVVTSRDSLVAEGPSQTQQGRTAWTVHANTGTGFDAGGPWALPDYGRPASGDRPWLSTWSDPSTSGLGFGMSDLTGDGVPDLVVTSRDGEVQAGPTRQGLGRGTWMVHPALCQE